MVYIPPTPDIRRDRPDYFQPDYEPPDFSQQLNVPFAMPRGVPLADPNRVPDLWPEIVEELRGIIKDPKAEFFIGSEDQPLTPEQEQKNREALAKQGMAGLQFMEKKKSAEFLREQHAQEKARTRVDNLQKQLFQAAKEDDIPRQFIVGLEKQYNSAKKDLDKYYGENGSGLPEYKETGKMEIKGYEKPPGVWKKIGQGLAGAYGFAKDVVTGGEAGPIEPVTPTQPGIPTGPSPMGMEEAMAPADMPGGQSQLPEAAGQILVKGLLGAGDLVRRYFGLEEGEAVFKQIKADNPATPGESPEVTAEKRLDDAINRLRKKNPNAPELKELERMRMLWKFNPQRMIVGRIPAPGRSK